MRYQPDPGPWLQYRKKPGNEKLSLQEATQQYKHEQLFHSLQNQPAHMAHASNGGKTHPAFHQEGVLRRAAVLWETNRASALKNYGEINTWDVSKVTAMVNIFEGLTSFNSDISNWDVSNVEYMTGMFYNTPAFNQDISSWNVEKVKSMTSMFQGATAFRQDLSAWNPFSLVTALFFMPELANNGANRTDYDALLAAWGAHAAAGDLQSNVAISFGTSLKYTKATSAAATGRAQLVAKGWTITDGGATS